MHNYFRQFRKRAPYCFGLILLLLALFFLVEFKADHSQDQSSAGIARNWGVAQDLMFVPKEGQPKLEVHGAFDVWDGEWWRIPISAFHHGGQRPDSALLELMLSLLGIGFLGYHLERFFPRWFFPLWIIAAAAVCTLPEFLLGNCMQGSTGIACALFGVSLALRKSEPTLREKISDRLVLAVLAVIGIGLLFRLTGKLTVPVASQLTGICYGWITGELLRVSPRYRRAGLVGFLLLHVGLIPLYSLVMHPFWSGHYHAYRAIQAEIHEENPDVIIGHLTLAVERDPSLVHAWRSLARCQRNTGQITQAWRSVLRGLNHNRSNEELVLLAADILRHMKTSEEQLLATQDLSEIFGKEANAWEQRIREKLKMGEPAEPPDLPPIVQLELPPPPEPPSETPLNQPIQLSEGFDFGMPEEDFPPDAPQIDPEEPNSAAAGELL